MKTESGQIDHILLIFVGTQEKKKDFRSKLLRGTFFIINLIWLINEKITMKYRENVCQYKNISSISMVSGS